MVSQRPPTFLHHKRSAIDRFFEQKTLASPQKMGVFTIRVDLMQNLTNRTLCFSYGSTETTFTTNCLITLKP